MSWYHRLGLSILIVLLLVSCSIDAASDTGEPTSRPLVQSARPVPSLGVPEPSSDPSQVGAAVLSGAGDFFLIDKLVRSPQIDGIDMHVRYVERTADGLVVHLSFYNNRGEDLAYVTGADVEAARLSGDDGEYPLTAHSASLNSGIDPDDGWLDGGANVGTLTFAGAQGETLTLEFPGFPAVELNLDQPMAEGVDPLPPVEGIYSYDLEVASSRLENIALRIEQARVEADALLLTIAFVNRNESDITFTSTVQGDDAIIFDGLWQQYRPGQVEQTLDGGIQPEGSVWGEGEANTGVLTFPRPQSGSVILFEFPSYPRIRVPLQPGEEATIATDSDLPPTAAPRPTPTAAPTPTPLGPEEQARQEMRDLLARMTNALSDRDRDEYLAAFAPELRETQGQLFDRIDGLPLEEMRIEPGDVDQNGVLSDDQAELSGYQAEMSWKIREVDPENIFNANLEYTAQRQDGSWQITSVGGDVPFWSYAETEAIRSGPFWIFYRPESAEELPDIEREAQQAFDLVNQALPNRAKPVNVMRVTATEQEFTDLTERSGERFLGVASARFRIKKAGISIASQAFFINSAAFEQDPQQDRQRTITHELTHLVLSPETMPYTPAWVSEGAAMFVSNDLPLTTISDWYRESGPDTMSLVDLSAKTSFGEHDALDDQTAIDYAYSAFLTRYLVEKYGKDQFFDFYDSFADVPFDAISNELPRAGDDALLEASMDSLAQKLAPQQVQDVFGVDLQMLESEYETWLGEQVE
ncbi:MAG TPA: hypothetical protein VGD69_32070 [Herpetosiphonaceae bacterium]